MNVKRDLQKRRAGDDYKRCVCEKRRMKRPIYM